MLPREANTLSVVLAGERAPLDRFSESRGELDFFELKGVFETLLDRLGVFSRPARFTEETMTRLWRESAMASGEESGPAPNRST